MHTFFLYIDPGSGSYLVQVLIAGILGSLFFFKNAWRKIKYFFSSKNKQAEEQPDSDL